MSRPTDRLYHFDTRVVRTTQLTPRMRRITVSCPELAVFHVENGPNIKLYFALPGGGRLPLPLAAGVLPPRSAPPAACECL